MQPNLEQTTINIISWVESSENQLQVSNLRSRLDNFISYFKDKESVNSAKNMLIGAIALRKLQLSKQQPKNIMLEQNYVDSVHKMD